jgi:hypothetical protein
MQPADEIDRGRVGQRAGRVLAIDVALHADVRARLQLKIPALRGAVEPPLQGRLDLARRRVVTLDQVRVVAVHDPHGLRQAGSRACMHPCPEACRRPREAREEVDNLCSRLVQQAGLDP